jgi:hypothetical protein
MKNQLIEDLKSLLKGTLSPEVFRENMETYPAQIQNLIIGNIDHFLDDADMRARDPEYRKMQETELTKLITLLELGASNEKIRAISFLTPTDD